MTRVAALYDIHAHLPALEAVLADVHEAGVERVVIGGDVVPGLMPRETMDALLGLEVPVDFIRGNGETSVLAEAAGQTPKVPEMYRPIVRFVAQELDAEQRAELASWPATVRLAIPGLGDVLFCHATPRDEDEIFTKNTAEAVLLPVFDGLGVSVVVCGHTHMQFDRRVGSTRVVNAGSVGMPYGEPGAYWLLLGDGVELRRTEYDLEAAAARLRRSASPGAEYFVENNVLRCPTEAQVLEMLAPAELK